MLGPVVEATGINIFTSDEAGEVPAPFTAIDGTPVDPDVVTFTYWIGRTLQHTYTYTNGSGDPDNVIVRDGTGLYHAYIGTAGAPGMYSWAWTGAPGVSGLDTTATEASCKGGPIEVCRLSP